MSSPTSPEPLPADPTLADYRRYAALNNPALEAAFNRWKAALEQITMARSLPDPRFTYRYYISEVETRVGAMRQAFGLSQAFPWIGKLMAASNAAAANARAEQKRFEAARLELNYKVAVAWYEYLYLGEQVHIIEENIRLLKHIEQVLRVQYTTATALHPDLLRAQVELGKLVSRRETLHDLRGPVVARLNAVLNRPPDEPLPWPKKPADEERVPADDELLYDQLVQHNPQLAALQADIEAAEQRLKLAEQNMIPDLTVGVEYVDIADPAGGARPSDAGKDALALSASVNIPIWWDKLSAEIRQARFRKRAAELARVQKTNDLATALKLAAFQYRDAERKVDLYRDTLLPKARQSVKVTEQAFRNGKATFTALLDAERMLLEFQLTAHRALADRGQRLAELKMLLGRSPQGLPAETDSPSDP